MEMGIPMEIVKEYFDETGDNNFTGIKYIKWLEKKLTESKEQLKNNVDLAEVSVSSVRKHIANLSEDDRFDFLCDVQEGYCNHCGSDENKCGTCHCWNDE